jgi:hypothetical protein
MTSARNAIVRATLTEILAARLGDAGVLRGVTEPAPGLRPALRAFQGRSSADCGGYDERERNDEQSEPSFGR